MFNKANINRKTIMTELKPIQAQIVGCDFAPEGYPEGAITIECLASGEVEVCAENIMIISHKHYKELIAAYEKLKEIR